MTSANSFAASTLIYPYKKVLQTRSCTTEEGLLLGKSIKRNAQILKKDIFITSENLLLNISFSPEAPAPHERCLSQLGVTVPELVTLPVFNNWLLVLRRIESLLLSRCNGSIATPLTLRWPLPTAETA